MNSDLEDFQCRMSVTDSVIQSYSILAPINVEYILRIEIFKELAYMISLSHT